MSFQSNFFLARAVEAVNGVTGGALEHMTSSAASSALRSASAVAVGVSVAAVAVVVLAYATGNGEFLFPSRRFRPPWARRKRHEPLSLLQWREAFDPVLGAAPDGGEKVIDVVRKGGVEHRIRAEVWPFVLGVYDFSSTREERDAEKERKKEQFLKLRELCAVAQQCLADSSSCGAGESEPKADCQGSGSGSGHADEGDLASAAFSDGLEESEEAHVEGSQEGHAEGSEPAHVGDSELLGESSANDARVDAGVDDVVEQPKRSEREEALARNLEVLGELDPKWVVNTAQALEDFGTWQRIIRLDAIRMNSDWVPFSPSAANVTQDMADVLADAVQLKDTEHLDAARKHFGARLVAIVEAYTLHDSETGYCQGMSDLLAPFVALIDDDFEAFWCFVNFMQAARHNFRMDETGIQRQLDLVARILKAGDPELYEHLVRIRSEDCTFVYRMILVFLRRELTFEQSLGLWEVIWADWAVLRRNSEANIGSKWRTPASSDLLLYTIAAAVRNKKKHILEYCRGMDDMLKECNDMAGHLDVWALLDDARGLVCSIHGTVR